MVAFVRRQVADSSGRRLACSDRLSSRRGRGWSSAGRRRTSRRPGGRRCGARRRKSEGGRNGRGSVKCVGRV
eukprot:3065519-Pleurochrysis_carterae.AAC.2